MTRPYIYPMNRRDFTKSLAALGLAPALPAMPAAAAATAPAYTPYMYGLGAHMARSTGKCSPEMLMHKLRLAPEAARAMQNQLVRSGILSAPGAAGLAAAAQPYMRGGHALGSGASTLGKVAKSVVKEALRDTPPDASEQEN